MADPSTHTTLHCPERGCRGYLAVMPGQWTVGRKLKKKERVRAGVGRFACDECGARYEAIPAGSPRDSRPRRS